MSLYTHISSRELQLQDIPLICNYWMTATPEYLIGMGVDLSKMPTKEGFAQFLEKQLASSYDTKEAYATIWEIDGHAIGHNNVNKIIFGKEAFMHLHVWMPELRRAGLGTALVKKSLPLFFENLQLQDLYCEPYAFNPAPHATLKKVGFEFVKTYTTIPGAMNFEQEVHLWHLSRKRYEEIGVFS